MRKIETDKKRFSLRFGWGTTIALIVALGIVLTGRLMRSNSSDSYAGPIVMQAGPDGKLHRVNASSLPLSNPGKPLKWEVQDLIINAPRLDLSSSQLARLNGLKERWMNEKKSLFAQMKGNLTKAKPQGSESIPKLTSDLAGYSRLSELFDERRNYYLRLGLAMLKPKQAKKWAEMQNEGMEER